MSICSFISDEAIETEGNQSYLNFSIETSNIVSTSHISNLSSPLTNPNLKKLQTLLFQTNFYLKKLEEKMNETQRTLDFEVFLRQLRSHQTVLSLKINSENIDDTFLNFVTEKHTRLLEEIKNSLNEKIEINCVSQITPTSEYENTENSCILNTPAFSASKSFSFKDSDDIDKQLAVKIEEVFRDFVSFDEEKEAFKGFENNFFRLRFPKISETLKNFLTTMVAHKENKKKKKFTKVLKNFEKENNEHAKKEMEKALALQEFHLNLSFLNQKNRKNLIQSETQTEAKDNSIKKIESLESQLKSLQSLLTIMQKDKDSIEKYQKVLIQQLTQQKPKENTEQLEFFKERFENTNKLFINLQDSYKSLTNENKALTKALEKRLACNHNIDEKFIINIINESRFELSSLIKDIEKNRLEASSEVLNNYITHLHKISLNLIFQSSKPKIEYSNESASGREQKKGSSTSNRSKSSMKSASERLDQYLSYNI